MKQTSQAKQIELIIFLVIGKVKITPVRERERERVLMVIAIVS